MPLREVAYWATLLVFLAIYVWVHTLADLAFPVPWPDEGSFLWQAIAVEERNTLFAPELNPYRDVMWMPPGYAILHGLLFKLTGFSLAWARALSAAYVMAGTVILAIVFRRYRYPYLYLVLCGLFLLSPEFVYTGNLARMEGLVFLGVAGGFAWLQRDRYSAGLCLIGLTPLVHPNGLFFCAGAGVYAAIMLWRHPHHRMPSLAALAPLVLCSLLWMGYLAYVAFHWPDFVSDMKFQFTWRDEFVRDAVGFSGRWAAGDLLMSCALVAGLVYGALRGVASTFLLAFAVPLHALGVVTSGRMYEIYASLLVLIVSVVWIEMGMQVASDLSRSRSRAWRRSLGSAVFVSAAVLLVVSGRVESPIGYPYDMTFGEMRIPTAVPYYSAEDRDAIRRFLRSLERSDAPIAVQFQPGGDALLFHDLRSERVRFVQPTFHKERAEVQIVHLSRYVPPVLERLMMRDVERGASHWLGRWSVLRERDGTERWLVHGVESASP